MDALRQRSEPQALTIVQVNRWGDCIVLNAQGGEVRPKHWRGRPMTRGEAEAVKREAEK